MNSNVKGRTQSCGDVEARVRLSQARAFLEVAELIGAEQDDLATPGVAAALAVLAGIAASDALCCTVLQERSRGQDHAQAVTLLGKVGPEGKPLAKDLDRLLAIKDEAHYGMLHVSGQRAASALKQARRMVAAVDARLSR